MTQRDARVYLWDIVASCAAIDRFTQSKTWPDYERDELLRSAVERQFIIIGEALKNAIEIDQHIQSRITDCHKIIGIRHRLAHDYQRTSHAIIWNAAVNHVPLLQHEVTQIVGDAPPLNYE